jgi:hypothetical protein
MLFIAQSWALWRIRNKLAIESRVMRHPADVIFKTMLFLQLWLPLARPLDRGWIRGMTHELKLLHAASLAPDG